MNCGFTYSSQGNIIQIVSLENYKCDGHPAIFVISDGNGYSNLNILDRRSGHLFSKFQDSLSYRDGPKKKIDRIVQIDRGKDGCQEVELFQMNGKRRTYMWNGHDYFRADRNINIHDGETVYYRDGTEDVVVVHKPSEKELFSAYRWTRSGWTKYVPKEFEGLKREYETINPGSDALAIAEKRENIIRQLLNYLR